MRGSNTESYCPQCKQIVFSFTSCKHCGTLFYKEEIENNKTIILDGTFECPGCGFREKHLARCSRNGD